MEPGLARQQTVEVQPLPEPTFGEMMKQWWTLQAEMEPIVEKLKTLRDTEQKLRLNIIQASFKPEPGIAFLEGTQYRDLGNGYRLKAELKVERKVQEEMLANNNIVKMLADAKINLQELLRTKHEVNVKPMRQLTTEQQKLFDTILVISQPMPTMEVVPPKEK